MAKYGLALVLRRSLALAVLALPVQAGEIVIDSHDPAGGGAPGIDRGRAVLLPVPGGGAGTVVVVPSPAERSSGAVNADAMNRNAARAGAYVRPDAAGTVILPSGNGATTGNDPAVNNANAINRNQQRARAYSSGSGPDSDEGTVLILLPESGGVPADANAVRLEENMEKARAYATEGASSCSRAVVSVGTIGDVVVVDRNSAVAAVAQGVSTTSAGGGCR